MTEGVLFALVQLVLWLPAGAFVAAVASALASSGRVARSPA